MLFIQPHLSLKDCRHLRSLTFTLLWQRDAYVREEFDDFYDSWKEMVKLIASLPWPSPLALLRINFLVSTASIKPDAQKYVSHVGWELLSGSLERFDKLEMVDTRVDAGKEWDPDSKTHVLVREAYILEFFQVALKDLCLSSRRYRSTISFADD